jgi:hypothetical protein
MMFRAGVTDEELNLNLLLLVLATSILIDLTVLTNYLN